MKYLLLLCLLASISCQNTKPGRHKAKVRSEKRILLFTKTAPGSYRHESIGPGKLAVMKNCQEIGIQVDTCENSDWFTDPVLKKYSALVFLSTNQDVFNSEQEAALQRYIRAGGGFAGIHAASGVERDWPWFGKMLGGVFSWHTPQQNAVIDITDPKHPSTEGLPSRWPRYDEWYFFRDLNPGIKVVATLDSITYKSDRHPANYPFAWYQEFEGGRSWYTAGGHNSSDFADPLFLKHILGGINYAIGDNRELDYAKVPAK
jgi:type 1 glutamine amidotransferase